MLEKGEDLSEILTSEKKTHLANHQNGIRGGVDGRFERSAYYLKHIHYYFFFVFNYPIMTFLLGPMKVQEGDKLSKAPTWCSVLAEYSVCISNLIQLKITYI